MTYVPVDFNVETLADRLRESGYRDGRKTVFLWEGVTPYLTAAAVDDVLRFVRDAGSGSAILFDYVIASLLDGTCDMRGARNELDKMSRSSEPLTFGIAQGQVEAFLRARGFHDVTDVGAEELKASYFGNGAADRYVKPWWRIASGAVP